MSNSCSHAERTSCFSFPQPAQTQISYPSSSAVAGTVFFSSYLCPGEGTVCVTMSPQTVQRLLRFPGVVQVGGISSVTSYSWGSPGMDSSSSYPQTVHRFW